MSHPLSTSLSIAGFFCQFFQETRGGVNFFYYKNVGKRHHRAEEGRLTIKMPQSRLEALFAYYTLAGVKKPARFPQSGTREKKRDGT